jgi:hypothetical protein
MLASSVSFDILVLLAFVSFLLKMQTSSAGHCNKNNVILTASSWTLL